MLSVFDGAAIDVYKEECCQRSVMPVTEKITNNCILLVKLASIFSRLGCSLPDSANRKWVRAWLEIKLAMAIKHQCPHIKKKWILTVFFSPETDRIPYNLLAARWHAKTSTEGVFSLHWTHRGPHLVKCCLDSSKTSFVLNVMGILL